MTKNNKSMQDLNKKSNKKVNLNKSLPVVLVNIFKEGDIFTKLSFLIMGFSNMVRGQIIKGCIFLATQIAFIYFLIMDGGGLFRLKGLTTLGEKDFKKGVGFQPATLGDDSRQFLLFGIATVVICILFLLLWAESIKSGYIAQLATDAKKKPNSFYRDIQDYFDSKIHRTLLFIPIAGIMVMTIIPIIFMISMAFTNFDSEHNGQTRRFSWTAFEAFGKVLNMTNGDKYSYTFWHILGWTLIWAVAATVTCYIGGIIIAMLINSKQVKFKAFWRTMFIMTAATPQFVTLLLMRTYLEEQGLLNGILTSMGILKNNVDWLGTPLTARIICIIVNFWIGVPFTILITTGILQNIPADLYEAAKVDGANTTTIFMKITLPYMLFVTTPYLIQTFVGNINNFNVIYLLTNGEPTTNLYDHAGKTDLLVTWLYKLSIDFKEFNVAAVVGILVFAICATLSLVVFRNTGAYNNEEEFQ